jgi:hypothetical protein
LPQSLETKGFPVRRKYYNTFHGKAQEGARFRTFSYALVRPRKK